MSYIENAVQCEFLYQQTAEVHIVHFAFATWFIKTGKSIKANGSMLFQQDLFKFLHIKLQMAGRSDNLMFISTCCNENKAWNGHTATLLLFSIVHNSIQYIGMDGLKSSFVWIEGQEQPSQCFVRYVLAFSIKIETTLKCTALVLCPAHDIIMNFSARYPCWLTKNGQTVVGLLAVRAGSNLNDTCPIHEGLLPVYWVTGIAVVHAG